jgi:hypothetical protein
MGFLERRRDIIIAIIIRESGFAIIARSEAIHPN